MKQNRSPPNNSDCIFSASFFDRFSIDSRSVLDRSSINLRSFFVHSSIVLRFPNGDRTENERRTNGERTENERRTNGDVSTTETPLMMSMGVIFAMMICVLGLENSSKKRFVFLRYDIGMTSELSSAKMERVLASLRVQSYNTKKRIPNFLQICGVSKC